MRTILALLLASAASCMAQLTNLTFTWDLVTNAAAYRFYEVQSNSNRLFLGSTTNLTFVVSNWNVSTSRTVTVTSTNMLGEGPFTNSLVVPPAPGPVQNLKPIPLSIATPVPGVLEFSHDLADWTQRLRIFKGAESDSVLVTWIQYPTEPILFMRNWTAPPLIFPPLP